MNVKEAVDRGVKFLDFFCPGWKDKINVNSIDIASTDRCILGQLFGSYLNSPMPSDHDFYYGFAAKFNVSNLRKVEEELTAEWKSRFIQTFDLSTDDVEPGKYIVFGVNQHGFIEGDVIDVLEKTYMDGLNIEENRDNLVLHNNRLYIDPPIVVTPKKG